MFSPEEITESADGNPFGSHQNTRPDKLDRSGKRHRWPWIVVLLLLCGIAGVHHWRSRPPYKAHPPLVASQWDTPLSPEQVWNPIALIHAKGEAEHFLDDQLTGSVSKVEAPKFPDLPLKAPDVRLWQVFAKYKGAFGRTYMPIWGPARFYVLESAGNYYLLTRTNFARAFGPVTNPKEVWHYLAAFEKVFGHPYGTIVRKGDLPDLAAGESVPAVSEIKRVWGGYNVRLVFYTEYRVRHFWQENVFLHKDGIVDEGRAKLLKKLGPSFAD